MGIMTDNLIAEPESISRMRNRSMESDWASAFNEVVVLEVIELLSAVTPRDEIAAKLSKSPGDVEQLVKTFGTWIAHTNKGAKLPSFKFKLVSGQEQSELFANETLRGLEAKRGSGTFVTIPLGFDKASGAKSQCEQSIARLLYDAPKVEQVTRFLARAQSSNAAPVISGRDIFTLWQFDVIERIEELDSVASSKTFAQRFVLSWDAVQGKFEEAAAAVSAIATFDDDTGDLESLRSAIDVAMWTAQAQMVRLAMIVDTALEAGTGTNKALSAELRRIRSRITTSPADFAPTALWHLNQGQVMRLIEALGLAEASDHRRTESGMRDTLLERGLRKDVDFLLPIGIEAMRVGCEDAYWTAVDAFTVGDPRWRDELADALADAVAA